MLDTAGHISYVQFLNAVHDEPTLAPSRLGSSLSRRERGGGTRLGSYPESAVALLSPAAAENLLRAQVQANTDTLLKASALFSPTLLWLLLEYSQCYANAFHRVHRPFNLPTRVPRGASRQPRSSAF